MSYREEAEEPFTSRDLYNIYLGLGGYITHLDKSNTKLDSRPYNGLIEQYTKLARRVLAKSIVLEEQKKW